MSEMRTEMVLRRFPLEWKPVEIPQDPARGYFRAWVAVADLDEGESAYVHAVLSEGGNEHFCIVDGAFAITASPEPWSDDEHGMTPGWVTVYDGEFAQVEALKADIEWRVGMALYALKLLPDDFCEHAQLMAAAVNSHEALAGALTAFVSDHNYRWRKSRSGTMPPEGCCGCNLCQAAHAASAALAAGSRTPESFESDTTEAQSAPQPRRAIARAERGQGDG